MPGRKERASCVPTCLDSLSPLLGRGQSRSFCCDSCPDHPRPVTRRLPTCFIQISAFCKAAALSLSPHSCFTSLHSTDVGWSVWSLSPPLEQELHQAGSVSVTLLFSVPRAMLSNMSVIHVIFNCISSLI